MRLIPRQRHRRPKGLQITISEAEISADLHYPAQARQSRPANLRKIEVR